MARTPRKLRMLSDLAKPSACGAPTIRAGMLQDSFQAYLAAFRAADPDGRGLSYLEFQTMLTPLSLTQLQLQSLMRAFDFNGDARITYAEFVPLAGQLSTDPSAASQAATLEPYPSQRPPSVCVPHSPVHETSHSPAMATPASEPPGV